MSPFLSRRRPVRTLVALVALGTTLAAAVPAGAQTDPGQPGVIAGQAPVSLVTTDDSGQVVVRATRITQSIDIDGRLDDAVYGEVPAITEFVQQEPNHGQPVSERTEVWLLFDDSNLYLACRCWDAHPENIVANDMRRDGSRQTAHDNFTVTLDTFHDRRNGYLFGITAAGGLRDGQTTDERPNMNWNAVFDGKASRFDEGWIAEMVTPFRSMRYSPGSGNTWGIHMRRFMSGKNERAHITAVSQGAARSPSTSCPRQRRSWVSRRRRAH